MSRRLFDLEAFYATLLRDRAKGLSTYLKTHGAFAERPPFPEQALHEFWSERETMIAILEAMTPNERNDPASVGPVRLQEIVTQAELDLETVTRFIEYFQKLQESARPRRPPPPSAPPTELEHPE
jgi:signal recognition particle GTPase